MVFLARTIPLEIFGAYSAYINIAGVLILFANFGFSEYLLVNSNKQSILKRNIKVYVNFSIYVLVIIILLSIAIPIKYKLLLILTFFKLYFENALSAILLSYYQVNNEVGKMSILNIFNGTLVLSSCFFLYKNNNDILHYLIIIIVIYLISFLVAILDIGFKLIPLAKLNKVLKLELPKINFYGFSMITIPLYMSLPNIIGALLISKDNFAIYQVAFSISNILLLVSTSLLQSDFPKFIKAQNIKSLKSELFYSSCKIIIINIALVLLFYILGEEILRLIYQKEVFVKSYWPLLILLASNLIFMLATIMAVMMTLKKEQKLKTRYHIEFIIFSSIIGLPVIYYLGVSGIVLTYLLLYIYVFTRYLNRFLKLKNIN